MLKVCSRFTISSTNGPLIGIKPNFAFSHRYHRFNRYTHIGLQENTVSSTTIINYFCFCCYLVTYLLFNTCAELRFVPFRHAFMPFCLYFKHLYDFPMVVIA